VGQVEHGAAGRGEKKGEAVFGGGLIGMKREAEISVFFNNCKGFLPRGGFKCKLRGGAVGVTGTFTEHNDLGLKHVDCKFHFRTKG